MIGVYLERLRSRIMLAVVKPSMPGMRTSMMIAAKSSSSTLRSASSPEVAVTRRAPWLERISRMTPRLAGSSSTMRMLAWCESLMVARPLSRERQQRVAAQRPHGGVLVHLVQRLARKAHELRLPAEAAEVGAPRGVEMIEHGVSAILEGRERGLLREVVDVADGAARVEQGLAAQHFLRRELQRDVEDLVLGLVAQLPQEAEVILDVLEDVHRHHQVEADVGLVEQVGELEGEPLVRLLRADLVRVGRDLVAEESRRRLEVRGQRPQDLSRAAADLAHRLGDDAVAIQHARDVLRLPRRVVDVPVGVVTQVRTVGVDRFHGSLSLGKQDCIRGFIP